MRGQHVIKSWAKAQQVIALSSGEAELYACVKVSAEAMGLKSVLQDMGKNAEIKIKIDASATIGIIMREGLTGIRHIDTQCLWVQDAVKQKRMEVKKVDGTANPADLLTKPLGAADLERHLWSSGCRW